ncbi:MAG: radical SAM protein [Candidatus Dadabacteria bacterium]|nr:MAG: radical SAM protein [Candidatus Dadabacteria bacterium]
MAVQYQFSAIYFEATRVCNLRCPVCMTASNNPQVVRQSRRQELTYEEIRDRVLVPAKRLAVRAVGWSGGEFLLRKDAFDLLRLTVDLGYKCNVCSNCELLDRDMLLAMKEATRGDLTIAVGLNSIGEDNEWSRNAEAQRTLEVLELCRELRIDRHVIITLGRYNADSFERTVDYLVKRRISYNRSPLVARGSGCAYFKDQGFTREDLKERFHPVLRRHVNGYVSYTPFFLSPELHEQVSGGRKNGTVPQNPPIGCWVGNWLALNAEGDVSVCPVLLDELTTGNVREKPLDELVYESKIFADLTDRSRLKGRCGRCRYQYTCGGCRAMAYYHTGDYLAEDPTCFFDPVDETTVSEYEEETNRLFKKYLIVARHAGFYERPDKPAGRPEDKPAPRRSSPAHGSGKTAPSADGSGNGAGRPARTGGNGARDPGSPNARVAAAEQDPPPANRSV